jgi:hypothetical protein
MNRNAPKSGRRQHHQTVRSQHAIVPLSSLSRSINALHLPIGKSPSSTGSLITYAGSSGGSYNSGQCNGRQQLFHILHQPRFFFFVAASRVQLSPSKGLAGYVRHHASFQYGRLERMAPPSQTPLGQLKREKRSTSVCVCIGEKRSVPWV